MEKKTLRDCNYAEQTFRSGAYVQHFVDRVVKVPAATSFSKILDLGCGTGSILIALAKLYPTARGCGIDISPTNIAAARQAALEQAVSDRIDFITADYTNTLFPAFDLIVCYSSLHLISCKADEIVAKLAAEVRHHGVLVMTLPIANNYNRRLFCIRRLFRAIRSRFTDWVILHAALILVRRQYSRQDILDRVSYMYVLPNLVWGLPLSALFESNGFVTMSCEPEPHVSIAQPKHVLVVLRRVG